MASIFPQPGDLTVRMGLMTAPIDCNSMSHASCYLPDSDSAQSTSPQAPAQGRGVDGGDGNNGASCDCVNDCASSLGVTVLLSGATTSLGCLMLPPACPIFIGTSVGTILGACEAACEDLESKP